MSFAAQTTTRNRRTGYLKPPAARPATSKKGFGITAKRKSVIAPHRSIHRWAAENILLFWKREPPVCPITYPIISPRHSAVAATRATIKGDRSKIAVPVHIAAKLGTGITMPPLPRKLSRKIVGYEIISDRVTSLLTEKAINPTRMHPATTKS